MRRRRAQAGFGEYFATPMGEYFAATNGLGAAMQTGQGIAYRDGALGDGVGVSFSPTNLIGIAIGFIGLKILHDRGMVKVKA